MIKDFDHVSIIVSNADKSSEFYQKALGLEKAERPDLGFPGHWLQVGCNKTIHIMELNNPLSDVERPNHGGRDFHFALRVDDLAVYIEKLDALNLTYSVSKSGRKALFFRDLDQNVIELVEV